MNVSVDWRTIASEELRFFGDVSAAISHEINNRIAVIHEKAGLLEDLAAMIAKGKDVDPERIAVQSRKIVDQVKLAKQIVRNLNRFAHSVDIEYTSVDVTELLELVVELYARKAARAEATLSVSGTGQPVEMTANRLVLATLIGRALEIALGRIGDSGEVTASAEATDTGIRLRFSGLAGVTEPIGFSEAQVGAPALLDGLGASFHSEADGTAILLEIPRHEHFLLGRSA